MNFPLFHRRRPRRKENTRFRNRERDSRLAVKVPLSRKEIQQRRKARSVSITRWSLIGVAVVFAFFYGRSMWKQAFRSPEFAVGRFQYHTNGGIPFQQAAAAAGLRNDMNLMDVDLSAIRTRLLALPRVKEVKVERRLPDHLSIELEERLPAAWFTSISKDPANAAANIGRDRRLFLDRDGIVFKCEEHLAGYMNLPVINAPDEKVITAGREMTSASVKAALALLDRMNSREWPVVANVSAIEIVNAWTLQVRMDSDAAYTFYPVKQDAQLDRLAFILRTARESNLGVATVNLQMQRNVPVTFFPKSATAVTPSPSSPAAAPEPVTQTQNVGFGPSRKNQTRPAAPPAPATQPERPRSPKSQTPASRQEQDIKSILRGR